MKKAILLASMFLAGAVLFTSCDKDDEKNGGETPAKDLIESVAGTYDINCTVGDSEVSIPAKLTISGTEDAKAKFVVSELVVGEGIPALTIPADEVALTGTVDDVKLTKWTGKLPIVAFGGECDIELTGSIVKRPTKADETDIDDLKKVALVVKVTPPAPLEAMTVAIDNEKPAVE